MPIDALVIYAIIFGTPPATLVVSGLLGKGWLRSSLAVLVGLVGAGAGIALWLVPASQAIGGHFEGAEWFLLIPVFIVIGYVAGVWLGMSLFRWLAPRTTRDGGTGERRQ